MLTANCTVDTYSYIYIYLFAIRSVVIAVFSLFVSAHNVSLRPARCRRMHRAPAFSHHLALRHVLFPPPIRSPAFPSSFPSRDTLPCPMHQPSARALSGDQSVSSYWYFCREKLYPPHLHLELQIPQRDRLHPHILNELRCACRTPAGSSQPYSSYCVTAFELESFLP